MKHMGSVKETTKSKSTLIKNRLSFGCPKVKFAVCINNGEYVDLQLGRLYSIKSDKSALSVGMLRIVDDSGEDYLYPIAWFAPVLVTRKATAVLKKLTQAPNMGFAHHAKGEPGA